MGVQLKKTFTFTTDNVDPPEAITAQTVCTRIKIFENAQLGTDDFYIYGAEGTPPAPSAVPVRYAAGKEKLFQVPAGFHSFVPGQVIGYIARVGAGALTIAQEEE